MARHSVGDLAIIDPPYQLEVGKTYPFVEMASVREGFGGIDHFGRRIWDRSGLCRFKERDLMLGKITPCAENGKAALVRDLPDNYGIGSTEFFVLSPAEGVNPEYFFAAVTAGPFHRRLVSRMEGSTGRLRITRDTLKKWLTFPLPPLYEQSRIAAALRLADDAINTARAELETTRKFKLSLASELVTSGLGPSGRPRQTTRLGTIPSGWSVSELRSLWASSTNGLYVPEDQYGSGVPIVRIDSFNDGFFETRNFKRIRVRPADVESFSLEKGDLLVNRVNSIPFLGKVAYVDEIEEFTVFESNMMRLRFPSHELSQYLALYLSVPAVKKRIWAMGRPAVAQLSINQRDVGRFLVALPGTDEREKIVKIVSSAKAVEQTALDKLEACLELKRSLLQDLLTGRVRLPEGFAHD